MAGAPNPFRDAFPWGNVVIGESVVPGVIESIGDCDKPEIWVYQRGLAASNAVSIWRGRELAQEIEIVTRLVDEAQFDDYVAISKVLRPNWYRPPVLPIFNGQMNFCGVQRISLKRIKAPVARPDLSWTGRIIVTEYNPMRPVPVGPADPPKALTENDRLEKEFSSLLAKAPSLFGNGPGK